MEPSCRPLPVCCSRSRGSSKAAVRVMLLCLCRDASPADLLPASAAEFPGLIPRSGSSLTLSSRLLRGEEARLSTQPWRRGTLPVAVTPLGAGWLRHPGLNLLPHACRRGRSISQLGEAAPHPAWCPQLCCSLRVLSLSQHGPGCAASLRTLGAAVLCRGWGLCRGLRRGPGCALPAGPDPWGEPAAQRLPLTGHLPGAHSRSVGTRADLSPWQRA